MADKPAGLGGVDTSMYRMPEGGGMMDVAGKAFGLAQQSTNLQQSNFNLQHGKLQVLNSTLSSLLADPDVQKGGPGAMQKIMGESGRLVSMGLASAKDVAAAVGQINPANPVQSLRQYQLQILPALDRMNAIYGNPVMVNNGREQQMHRVSPFMGGMAPVAGGRFTNQPTPGQLIQPVVAPPDPVTGAPRVQPAIGLGVGTNVLNPDGTMRYGGGSPPLPPVRPTNRLPMQPQAPQVQQAPQAPVDPTGGASLSPIKPETPGQKRIGQLIPTSQTGYGMMQSGLPPGQAASQELLDKSAAAGGANLQNSADTSTNRRSILANLEKDLAGFESGPMASKLGTFKAGANQLGGIVGVTPFDKKVVAAQENYTKGAAMLAQEQFKALGGTGSDQQLGSAVKSNPNAALSKEGNKGIIALLKGNEDAIAVKNDAWQKWRAKNGPNTYAAFSSDFNKSFSPRAFQWVHLSKEDRTKMYNSMTQSERANLATALKTAEQRGWINPEK